MKPWPFFVRLLILALMFPGLRAGNAFNHQLLLGLILTIFLALALFGFSQEYYFRLTPAKIEFLGLGLQLSGTVLLYLAGKFGGGPHFGLSAILLFMPYLAGLGFSIIGATWGLALTTRKPSDRK